MKLSARVSVAALVAAGALPALVPATAPAEQVGTVAAVNRDMAGTPPGESRRELNLGLDVVRDERVETSSVGSGQLMFLDQTTLTVSPNADIVLDQYVYNPDTGASDLALSMTKGALRFIGGRITKTGPATVRTPTATVGIRGGMAVLDVDDNGDTEVIHIAGEYTMVMQCGDANGDGLDDVCSPDQAKSRIFLSRPGASAKATRGEGANRGGPGGGGAGTVGSFIGSGGSAGSGGSTGSGGAGGSAGSGGAGGAGGSSGSGGSGGVVYTGLVSPEKLAELYGKLEGQGQGGVERAPSDGAVQGGSREVASVNSGVPGGETNQPVSTTGEQPTGATGQAETFNEPITVTENANPAVGGQPGDAEPGNQPPPPPPPPPTGTLVTEGGAVFSPTSGFQPFVDVLVGSIIGKADGQTVEFPVPDSPAGLLSAHPDGAEFTPLSVSTYLNTGLFEFGPDTASSSTLGPLSGEFGTTGIGLADFEHEFVFVPFRTDNVLVIEPGGIETDELGIALFGTPTPGQGQFFPGDPGITGAQTVDAYHNEAGLDLGRSFLILGSAEGRSPVPEELFLVGKSGQPRFTEDVTGGTVPTVIATGRAVSGAFQVSDSSFGRIERLALFVEPLTSSTATPATEMTISGKGFVTENGGGAVLFGEPAYGTFEDAQGHTLFGTDPAQNYFVLSSVHRDGDGSLNTTNFGTDEVFLSTAATDGVETFGSPFRASLFARDAAASEVISDPLPLAGEPGLTRIPNTLDGGFSAALAICSTGNCGVVEPPLGEPFFAGAYPLFSAEGPAGMQISFDESSAGMTFVMAMSDEIDGVLNSNIGGAGRDTDPGQFIFNVATNASFAETDEWGAYLDDRRFAAVGTGTQVIAGNNQLGTVGLGSSGLVGTGGAEIFPAGVETAPEYLRWGYWSATYQVTDGTTGQTRTDVVPVGTFVAGNIPDPTTVPFSGSATYGGFAVGTVGDISTGETRTVGGSFAMTYDFGQSHGTVDINLPTFSTPSVSLGVDGVNGNLIYSGSLDTETLGAEVRGSFFAGGGDPVAATGGNFGIDDRLNGQVAAGVYGGDQTSFTPAAVAAAAK